MFAVGHKAKADMARRKPRGNRREIKYKAEQSTIKRM